MHKVFDWFSLSSQYPLKLISLIIQTLFSFKDFVKAWRSLEASIRKYCTKFYGVLKIYSGKMLFPEKGKLMEFSIPFYPK